MPNLERFWSTIEMCRSSLKQGEDLAGVIVAHLEKGSASEIFDFQVAFDECLTQAYRWDLWGAAYIINGGCSDDGFDYFLGWLIAQGRSTFEAALDNPERLAEIIEPGTEADYEAMWYVASRAYEGRTGKEDFYEQLPTSIRGQVRGAEWAEEDLPQLFPKLTAKFVL